MVPGQGLSRDVGGAPAIRRPDWGRGLTRLLARGLSGWPLGCPHKVAATHPRVSAWRKPSRSHTLFGTPPHFHSILLAKGSPVRGGRGYVRV